MLRAMAANEPVLIRAGRFIDVLSGEASAAGDARAYFKLLDRVLTKRDEALQAEDAEAENSPPRLILP